MAESGRGEQRHEAPVLRLVHPSDEQPSQASSDAALVGAIVEGDERAYELLVRRHQAELFSLLVMETGSTVRAEDALQETLLTLARSAHTVREPERIRYWLRRVARNVVRHRTASRRANRDRDELGHPQTGLEEPAPDSDPATLIDGDVDLDRALRSLPHDQRRAVWLCSIQGWTHREVAEVYDVSVNTVSSWVRRGHARLAADLAATAPAPEASPAESPMTDERGRRRL